MSGQSDSRRVDKATKHLLHLDSLPSNTRIKVPWRFAVDLGFAQAREAAPPQGGTYDVPQHPDITLYENGVIVSVAALKLAVKAAPRAVRHRIRGFVL